MPDEADNLCLGWFHFQCAVQSTYISSCEFLN